MSKDYDITILPLDGRTIRHVQFEGGLDYRQVGHLRLCLEKAKAAAIENGTAGDANAIIQEGVNQFEKYTAEKDKNSKSDVELIRHWLIVV